MKRNLALSRFRKLWSDGRIAVHPVNQRENVCGTIDRQIHGRDKPEWKEIVNDAFQRNLLKL